MTSNAAHMTVEERIVQTIKTDTMLSLVGDEDAIHELAKRAVKEALFAERKKFTGQTNYSGAVYADVQSPVMEAATEAARNACAELAETVMQEVLADPKVKAAIFDAVPLILFHVMKKKAEHAFDNSINNAIQDRLGELQTAIYQLQNR